jgi:hypothetical protein
MIERILLDNDRLNHCRGRLRRSIIVYYKLLGNLRYWLIKVLRYDLDKLRILRLSHFLPLLQLIISLNSIQRMSCEIIVLKSYLLSVRC